MCDSSYIDTEVDTEIASYTEVDTEIASWPQYSDAVLSDLIDEVDQALANIENELIENNESDYSPVLVRSMNTVQHT